MTDLLDQLSSVLGAGELLDAKATAERAQGIYNHQPIKALALARPSSVEAVSKVLKICHEHRQPVVTHGGLTGLVHGADSDVRDLILSTERLNRIENIDPVNRTMTVQAGVILQKIHEAASEHGMHFALDLGARGSCTIGGNLATNAGGNQVIRYGMAREQVLGLEAVMADGTIVSSMNHMLKNNAGYDLKHLFVGSEGTLGIITRAVLRLREAPADHCTALVAVAEFKHLVQLLKHMDAGLGGALSAFEVMWEDYYRLVTSPDSGNTQPLDYGHPYYVLMESEGSGSAAEQDNFEELLGQALEQGIIADAALAQSGQDRTAFWAIRDDVDQSYQFGPPIMSDVSMKISDMEGYVESVRSRLAADWDDHQCWIFGHMGDGNLHIVIAVGDDGPQTRAKVEQALYEPLKAINGSVSAEHGIGLEKKRWLPASRSQNEIQLMRTLKLALDPHQLLNPGKILDA